MKYLLDTNACIRFINGRVPQVRQRFFEAGNVNIGVSIITKAELFYGSAKSQTPEISRQIQTNFLQSVTILMLDDTIIDHYAVIRTSLERRGMPIGSNDLFIAATALAHDLILVTHNTGEFGRIPALKLEDWEV